MAKEFISAKGSMFLGRGSSFPIALEGALKLKELSYLHAEGYPAGEMKHGPLALIEEGLPVIVIAPKNKYFEKTISNMQEVIARGGKILFITDNKKDSLNENIRFGLRVPHIDKLLSPILLTLPLQLLAYHVALLKNCDVDKPRNLAKSVTVEWDETNYKAMVLSCIDPRFQPIIYKYLKKKKLNGKYSFFHNCRISCSVTSNKFKKWHKAFWDNFHTSVKLHNIKKLIVINHRDCGAAKLLMEKEFSKVNETNVHKKILLKLKRYLRENIQNSA